MQIEGLLLGDGWWPATDPAFLYIYAPPLHSCSSRLEGSFVVLFNSNHYLCTCTYNQLDTFCDSPLNTYLYLDRYYLITTLPLIKRISVVKTSCLLQVARLWNIVVFINVVGLAANNVR